MLEFKNISVWRGKRNILRDVSFGVPTSSITVLLGKNGSGKSTLFDCVTGQVKFSGNVTLDGRDISVMSPRSRAKEIALLPQTLSLTPLTVYELVSLGRYAYMGDFGILSSEDKRIIESSISVTGIEKFSHRPCDELSGGERQKAYLAMVLAQNSPYLLFDEPTTYLDISYRREMYSIMRTLAKEHGRSLLVVMHDISEAVAFADFICVLDGGSIAFSGTTEEFLSCDLPESIFGVERHTSGDRIFFA